MKYLPLLFRNAGKGAEGIWQTIKQKNLPTRVRRFYSYNQFTISKKVSNKKDELKVKIAEFKEKGINTDELERVLAECEAEMGTVTEDGE